MNTTAFSCFEISHTITVVHLLQHVACILRQGNHIVLRTLDFCRKCWKSAAGHCGYIMWRAKKPLCNKFTCKVRGDRHCICGLFYVGCWLRSVLCGVQSVEATRQVGCPAYASCTNADVNQKNMLSMYVCKHPTDKPAYWSGHALLCKCG